MRLGKRRVLLCSCEDTMTLDGPRLAESLEAEGAPQLCRQLCRSEIATLLEAARDSEDGLLVACTQEGLTFQEQLEAAGLPVDLRLFNIRETAGWSRQGPGSQAKIAALIEEAQVDPPLVPSVTMTSSGVTLVYGAGAGALEAARQLSRRLPVSLLLTDRADALPLGLKDIMIASGRISAARGHLGAFELTVAGYAPLNPSARSDLSFAAAQEQALSRCDLILDLSGRAPLFPSHERRDGYFRPDPGDPIAVQKALFEIVDLAGEFEKPRYVKFREDLCAHARNRIAGCTRCLDHCPASAITSAGDSVAIDPYLCGGCGACHSACPTGAAAYDYPPGAQLLERLRRLLGRYEAAGGTHPRLLVYDERDGWPLIEAVARFGQGLPANVLPFQVNEITQLSFDQLMSALAYGAAEVMLLGAPRKRGEMAALAQQIGYCEALMTGLGYESGLVNLILEDDPEALESLLSGGRRFAARAPGRFIGQDNCRANLQMAAAHLHDQALAPVPSVALPPGAPRGAVALAQEGCTLCLACVSACPTGALGDNPDRPQVTFQEEACVQCGLCQNTCPEKVITLVPRYDFTEDARKRRVLHEEEPFCCVSCGKPFGAKSTIEKMIDQLAGRHPMFQGAAAERLKMCEDCRVVAQFQDGDGVMAGAQRPRVRTTDDYRNGRFESDDGES
jgi:ferredoxin